MPTERLFGYEYFLVTEVPQHKDYMIRQVSAKENHEDLAGENCAVVSVPRVFLNRLSPTAVGEKLVSQYLLEKQRDNNRTLDLVEIDRYFGVNGISLGELKGVSRSKAIQGLARVCLKEVPAGSTSAFDDS